MLKMNNNDADSKYFVIFSHQSFENEFAQRGVYNRNEVTKLINKTNATGKKVLLCMNGHYQNISPEELGINVMWNGRPISPVVSSLNLTNSVDNIAYNGGVKK